MQEASAKLASGQNVKIGYEIDQIKKSLDKMDLEMKGIDLDFLKLYQSESEALFIKMDMGEDGETVKRIEEQDMDQFAHDKPQVHQPLHSLKQ